MKLLLTIFTLLLLAVLVFAYNYRHTVTAMQSCIDTATITAQTDLGWLSPVQSQAAMCDKARSQYANLTACYQGITHRYFIPTALVETIMAKSYPNYPLMSRNQAFLNRACP